mgnify:FL=1
MSCGLIIEGQPVNTGPFQPADGTNLKFTTVILNPQTVPTIMLFLIPSNPIPPNHGIVLYCSSPTNPSLWSFLGSVTQTSPSKLLRTGEFHSVSARLDATLLNQPILNCFIKNIPRFARCRVGPVGRFPQRAVSNSRNIHRTYGHYCQLERNERGGR